MRIRTFTHVLLLVLGVTVSSAHGQFLPWNIPVNSSFRVGYLYGSQVVSSAVDPVHDVQLDISFGFPILSGALEFSPINPLSVRLIGDVSVYGQQNIIYGPWWTAPPVPTAPPGLYSNARPGFVGVEAAALFDVWRPAGHRFGVVGGWRREYWWYNDEGTNDVTAAVYSRDNVTSNVPFVGLCAEMAYPGWRSTFEFLTSRFIYKTINGSVSQLLNYGEYHCAAQDGVLLEARVHGMTNITDNLLLGLYGRYAYQNVSGVFDGLKDSVVTRSLDVHVVENALTLQLQLTLFF